jgi:hypothetical protein
MSQNYTKYAVIYQEITTCWFLHMLTISCVVCAFAAMINVSQLRPLGL